MKKRIFPLLLALSLCLGLAAPALASSGDFVIENGVLTAYHGPGGDVVIPNGVTSIGDSAFQRCENLNSVTIPDGVTSIGMWAFSMCYSLSSVNIPSSVTSIGIGAFAMCYLDAFQVDPGSQTYTTVDGVLYNRSLDTLVAYPGGREGVYRIPSGTTTIGAYAFYRSSLSGVTIPSGVTRIEDSAFEHSIYLENVTIPNSVTSIGAWAFSDCALENVTIPNSVTSIERCAFYQNGLTSVTIPNSVTRIEEGMFGLCVILESVTIPSSVTSIGEVAFADCTSLKDVYYGGSEAQWNAIQIAGNNETLTSATIHYNSPMPAAAIAYASTQTVLVDGRPVEFQAYALKDENGNDTNYVKLRDVAFVLNGSAAQFDVGWDQAAGAISVTAGQPYKTAGGEMSTPYSGNRSYAISDSPLYINGQSSSLAAIRLTDDAGNGYTYFKLRDLGEALGFTVGWSEGTGIFIETK